MLYVFRQNVYIFNIFHSQLTSIISPFAVEKRPIDFPAIFNWGADDLQRGSGAKLLFKHNHSSHNSVTSKQLPNCNMESNASFLCSECPKTFPKKRNLVRHTKSLHVNNEFVCDSCGKPFSREDHLNRHKFSCKPCTGKLFNTFIFSC